MRNILLAVSGLSPQIITEAMYALLSQGKHVDELHIITTEPGKRLIDSWFIVDNNGPLQQLLRAFGIDPSTFFFGSETIYVPKKYDKEITDIFSEDDNEVLLALCLEKACRFTALSNNRLWFLVAGGRKTMTSCLTLAAQIYGRKQDRIFHVLMSPDFENSPDFWYPPKEPTLVRLKNRNGEFFYKNARYAKINLISIPFVSVRHHLENSLLSSPHSPGTLLASLIREDRECLVVSLKNRTVSLGSRELDLNPACLALYAFFITKKLTASCPADVDCLSCSRCCLSIGQVYSHQPEITELYNRIIGQEKLPETMSDTGIASLTSENFNSYKSKIKKKFEAHFGYRAAELIIAGKGKRPDTRYGILYSKERIVME